MSYHDSSDDEEGTDGGSSNENGSASGNEGAKVEADVLWGRRVPRDSIVSFQIEQERLIPVLWGFGPAYCAYCENFKSLSFQALYKHMKSIHEKEIADHDFKLRRYTVMNPVGRLGDTLTCRYSSKDVLRATAIERRERDDNLKAAAKGRDLHQNESDGGVQGNVALEPPQKRMKRMGW